MFTPSQKKLQYALTPELDQFRNRILSSKQSDSTLQLLGKALSYSFISSNTPDYDANSYHENP